jgi:LysR family glycine cleavage system transcriptional activator
MVAPTHLKSLQALELAARLGSLKDAAAVLAITPAAVGQRVKALEDYLGRDLLMRGRSGLKPAPALESALGHLRAAFNSLDLASEALNLERVHELHIAGPSDFVELWLAPRLPRFRKAFPAIRFSLNGEGDAPLRFSSADCEISFGPRREPGEADVLFRDYVLPVATVSKAFRCCISISIAMMLQSRPGRAGSRRTSCAARPLNAASAISAWSLPSKRLPPTPASPCAAWRCSDQ